MVFSTELANNVVVSDNNSKYLEAGIHDNVKLTGVRTADSPTGNKFIEFTFEKDGKIATHTEWEPKPREGYDDAANQSKATNQVTRIMRILRCFYPKEALIFSGNSYKEFANWVVSMLNSANKDILLRAKIVYNEKGYTTLPSYVKFAFIEPMEIPMGYYEEGKNESKITQLSIDQFTKPVVADKEEVVTNPLDTTMTTGFTQVNDELPF